MRIAMPILELLEHLVQFFRAMILTKSSLFMALVANFPVG